MPSHKDILVMGFFEKEENVRFDELIKFLVSYSLPLKEKWLYFWRGTRLRYYNSDLDLLFETEDLKGINEPETVLDLWDEFIESRHCYVNEDEIVNKLLLQGVVINDSLIESEINSIGWTYVKRRLSQIEDNLDERGSDLSAWEEQRFYDNPKNYYSNDNYCKACQSEPCICSDATSRT